MAANYPETFDEDSSGPTSSADELHWNIGSSDDESGILSEIKIPQHLECSHLNTKNGREALLLFGAKQFLVNHDYIFFPYCILSDGVLQRPLDTRVSEIVNTLKNNRYMLISDELALLDSVLNVDTSLESGLTKLKKQMANYCRSPKINTLPETYKQFVNSVRKVLISRRYKRESEAEYRSVCVHFLRLLTSSNKKFHIQEDPGSRMHHVILHRSSGDVELPVSAKPDILITEMPDELEEFVVLVVKCKKYREMDLKIKKIPNSPEEEEEIIKISPKVKFSGILKKSAGDTANSEVELLDNMYQDLDANICRHLTKEEKKYFGLFIAQATAEMLAWFASSYADIWMKGTLPPGTTDHKTVRYAICVVGFKLVFLTLGMNSNYAATSPHITVGKQSLRGVELFMTRPFDMMLAADRAVIKDIMFALTS